MNGNHPTQQNPMNWPPTVWRLFYKESVPIIVWATDLEGAIKAAECSEKPTAVEFNDICWVCATKQGIRRAMREVARAGGMSGAIAA
jgi:hypothetical protein